MKKAAAFVVLVVCGLLVLGETAYWVGHRIETRETGAGSCIVLVLGYPTAPDGTPHPIQHLRVEAGVSAFRANRCAQIVFSGAAVDSAHAESESMAQIARFLGVPESSIVVEDRARTTWENIGCAIPYLREYDRLLIASDSLHVHRAKRYACRQKPSLCGKVQAIGGYQPFALLWWKVPAAAYELRAWVRDLTTYERTESGNDPPCPDGESRESVPAAAQQGAAVRSQIL